MDGIFETAEWNSRTSPRLLSLMPASGSWLPRRKHCRVAGWLVRVWRGAWSWYTAYWFRDKHHPIYQGLPVSSGGLRHEQYLQGLFPHLFGIVCDTLPFMIMQSLRCIQHISAHTKQRQLVAKVAMFATELCPLVFACVTEVIRIIFNWSVSVCREGVRECCVAKVLMERHWRWWVLFWKYIFIFFHDKTNFVKKIKNSKPHLKKTLSDLILY